ncbi:MAG: hypothetical protein AAB834_07875 [Patescibacteria group bacterium]
MIGSALECIVIAASVIPSQVADDAASIDVYFVPAAIVDTIVPSPFLTAIVNEYAVLVASPVLCHVLLRIHPLAALLVVLVNSIPELPASRLDGALLECIVIAVVVIPSYVPPVLASIDVYLLTAPDVPAPPLLYACTFLVYCVFANNPVSLVAVALAVTRTLIALSPSSILNPLSSAELSVHVYRSPVVDSDVDAKFVGSLGALNQFVLFPLFVEFEGPITVAFILFESITST